MVDYIRLGVSVVVLLLSVGLMVYGARLVRLFKGGLMEHAFKLLFIAPGLVAANEVAEIVGELGVGHEILNIPHLTLEVAFIALLFLAYRSLSRVWLNLSRS